MGDIKGALSSKTIWGGIIAVLAGIAGSFGYTFGLEDQAGLADAAVGVVGAIGGIVAVYGRVVAKKKIG